MKKYRFFIDVCVANYFTDKKCSDKPIYYYEAEFARLIYACCYKHNQKIEDTYYLKSISNEEYKLLKLL